MSHCGVNDTPQNYSWISWFWLDRNCYSVIFLENTQKYGTHSKHVNEWKKEASVGFKDRNKHSRGGSNFFPLVTPMSTLTNFRAKEEEEIYSFVVKLFKKINCYQILFWLSFKI